MTRTERWLTGIAVTGVTSSIVAVGFFWLLFTAPERAAVPAHLPQQFAMVTDLAWHLVVRIAQWL